MNSNSYLKRGLQQYILKVLQLSTKSDKVNFIKFNKSNVV